jgi:hypothetical protein
MLVRVARIGIQDTKSSAETPRNFEFQAPRRVI